MTTQLDFRHVALIVSTSVWSWVQAAGLEVVDGHVLLALSAISDPAGATEIADQSQLPLGTVFPAVHRLMDHGYVHEEHRLHGLTDRWRELVAEFDASYWPSAEAVLASA